MDVLSRERVIMCCYAGWMILLTVALYAFPAWHVVLYSAVGLTSAGAIGVGVVIWRPRRRGLWLLLAGALVTFSAGDTTYDVLTGVMGQDNPFPSAADVLYLAMYPLLAAGLLGFIRCRSARGDRASLLDALIVTTGLTLLSWVFLIVPYVRNPDLTVLERATSIAYPLGDVLILAILARLLAGAGRRTRAVELLGVGTAGLLVADVLYGLIQINGSWHTGTAVDLGWVVFYAAWGGAALHPSMRQLTQPRSGPPTEGGSRRLALLALMSLIAPAVLAEESARGTVHDAPIIAVLSGVMFLLVLSRLAGVAARHRRAVARERGLRQASAALVSAADGDAVAAAIRTAVGQLLPPDMDHRVILVVSDGEQLRPVGPDSVVNDTLGHSSGDELLMAVAQRLTGLLRPHDTAARVGGDEFAVLIEGAISPAEVDEVAERIVTALATPFTVDRGPVGGGASVGVATTVEAADAAELLRRADLALYAAKAAGKGQWRRYQATLHTAMVERMELRAALEQALAKDAFTLRFQPIVHLGSGEVAGFEALVRWRHPTHGLIRPNQFIEVAEESGLIVPLGSWVLERALVEAAGWQPTPGRRRPYVSVNVSARQVRAGGFVEGVRAALARSTLPPQLLMLEITESLLLRDDQQIFADLTTLHELGVKIAIDDFGTGYSSLSYLQQFPIDVLKIDKSFIDHTTASAKQTAVVEAIIRLAGTLDLQVIAEGIQDAAQRDVLTRMGCPFGQGYLFARPLTGPDAARRLLRRPPSPAAPSPLAALPSLFSAGPDPAYADVIGKEAHG